MRYIFIVLMLIPTLMFSQVSTEDYEIDGFYLEDQLLIGINYNLLDVEYPAFTAEGLSVGLDFGFIRDMPINKRGNIGFGLGVIYSLNSINNNLLIIKNEEDYSTEFSVLENVDYDRNSFNFQTISVPLEFRWRNSTALKHKFWRVYLGVKASYSIGNYSKYKNSDYIVRHYKISEKQKWDFGPTLLIGYNLINIYGYMGLNSIFDDLKVQDQNINSKYWQIGIRIFLL